MPRRAGLIHLMALIAVLAVGFAALRSASPILAAATSGLVLISLLVALLAVVVRPSPGPSAKGFALFGWAYLCLAIVTQATAGALGLDSILPSDWAARWAVEGLHPLPWPPLAPTPSKPIAAINGMVSADGVGYWQTSAGNHVPMTAVEAQRWKSYQAAFADHQLLLKSRPEIEQRARQISQALFTLLFAVVGAIVGPLVAGLNQGALGRSRRASHDHPPDRPGATRWP